MNNEHNPVAQLVTKIQQKWAEEISSFSGIRLVRWLIDPEHAKLYEGFLRLESSPHGKLPEIFIALLTPFQSRSNYSNDLIKAWFDAYDQDKKIFDQLTINGKPFIWNENYYRQQASSQNIDQDKLFLEILASFHAALNMPDRTLTIALLQTSISSTTAFNEWMKTIVKSGIPQSVQFCIFDSKYERYYDRLFSSLDSAYARTLVTDIDLAGAVKKVIQAGNPNDPATRLQQYIQLMAEAVSEKDLKKLHNKGQACLEDMIRSKIKSLMATACIAYAGMLFHFREYEAIEELLNKGLQIAETGKKTGDVTCMSLITQFYSFKASNYQLNKKYKEAMEWFCRSAKASLEMRHPLPAITSYRQAAFLAKKYESSKYPIILESAYTAGAGLNKEELSLSDYCFVCFDYYNFLYHNGQTAKCNVVNNNMKEIFGFEWKEGVQEKLSMMNPKTVAA